jgi:hypothetical protein
VLREIAASGRPGPILAGGSLAARLVLGRPEILVDDSLDDSMERATARLADTRERKE